MSRRQPIPGVDEAALDALAGQFPSGSPRPVAPLTRDQALLTRDKAPLAQDNVPPPHGDKPIGKEANKEIGKEANGLELLSPALPEASPRKAAGRGLAVGAMMLALLAVLIAVSAVMPPPARLWLTRTLGDTAIVNFLTAGRADIDRRLAAAAQSIDALANKEAALATKQAALATEVDARASAEDVRASRQIELAARIEAIETVVGSGAAMQRLDDVERGLGAADQLVAAAGEANREAERMAAAHAEALDAKLAAFDGELKTVQDKLAAAQRDFGDIVTARLGAVEATVGELQKIDRRPEKFFLAALQLRDLTRTANPFAREVAAAQALAGPNAELLAALKVLAADADHGVATVAELRHDFAVLVAPRLAAVAAANRQSVAAQAWGWVQSQFTTASAGAAGERNAAVVTLATRSLDQGQLEAAVHQLLLLEDEAALVAAEWLKNASVRLAADKAMATIMSQALEQLAASN
jgi:hypothetical protein